MTLVFSESKCVYACVYMCAWVCVCVVKWLKRLMSTVKNEATVHGLHLINMRERLKMLRERISIYKYKYITYMLMEDVSKLCI